MRIIREPQFILGLIAAILLALGSAIMISYSVPSPDYINDAQILAQGDYITSDFQKIGYPIFLWLGLKFAGIPGIVVSQTLLYLLVVASSYVLARRGGLPPKWALFVTLIICAHPYLLANIKRIVDTNLSALLLVLISVILTQIGKKTWGLGIIALSGLLLGYTWLTRPNYILILLLIPTLLWVKGEKKQPRRLLTVLVPVLIGLITVAGMSKLACGKIRMMTTDGGYTLFTGANPWTGEQLLLNLNTEGETPRNLRRLNIDPNSPDLEKIYLEKSFHFIREHPGQYLWFGALKIINVFRPDYRRAAACSHLFKAYIIFFIQTIIALPFPIWAALRISRREKVGWKSPINAGTILILFLIPLFFYSTDPRYRLPCDLILIIDSVIIMYQTRKHLHVPH